MTQAARTEALARGDKFYETGIPCARGHIAKRYVNSWTCTECKKIRESMIIKDEAFKERQREAVRKSRKKLYPKNRDKILAAGRRWRTANPEKYARLLMTYRLKHRKKAAEVSRKWRKSNPEKVREYSNRHRVRKLCADGNHTLDDARRIRAYQKDKCALCSARLKGGGHLDHIISLARGGSDWPRNLQWLCAPCNVSKSARDPIEFSQSRGMLL